MACPPALLDDGAELLELALGAKERPELRERKKRCAKRQETSL